MLDRFFRLSEHGTNVRTELLAGLTTFLTMAYIIFLQPAILCGEFFGVPNGMDKGAVMTATCLAAALATAIMGLYARYPIAQAPGMGENFVFALSAIPAAGAMITAGVQSGSLEPDTTTAWQVALGVVFIAGVLFLFGLMLTAGLHARRIPGAIVLGILVTTVFAIALQAGLACLPAKMAGADAIANSTLVGQFSVADRLASLAQ